MQNATQVSFVVTSSLHLATLLGTIGCKHLKKIHGPERTSQGTPKVKWVFECTPQSEEAIALWKEPIKTLDWDGLTREQRACVINIVAAFGDNLKHYIKHTKEVK